MNKNTITALVVVGIVLAVLFVFKPGSTPTGTGTMSIAGGSVTGSSNAVVTWASCNSDSDCLNGNELYLSHCACQWRLVPKGKVPTVDCESPCNAVKPSVKCVSNMCNIVE